MFELSYREISIESGMSQKTLCFFARMMILFVILHNRNARYGNGYYDKIYLCIA